MPPTVFHESYEWDAAKELENQRKHRIAFAEAATALAHPQTAVFDDGSAVGRLKAVGMSRRGHLLTVVFEERGERERIISAWRSTREEQKLAMRGGA